MKVYSAIAADVVCVLLFAVIGRTSHNEANNLAGVLGTAWPFLAGCALGLLLARVWRRPAGLRTGLVVWVGTAAAGIALRLLGGATAAWPFVIVATLSLGLLIVGWRALYGLVRRARAERQSTHLPAAEQPAAPERTDRDGAALG